MTSAKLKAEIKTLKAALANPNQKTITDKLKSQQVKEKMRYRK